HVGELILHPFLVRLAGDRFGLAYTLNDAARDRRAEFIDFLGELAEMLEVDRCRHWAPGIKRPRCARIVRLMKRMRGGHAVCPAASAASLSDSACASAARSASSPPAAHGNG